MKLITASSLALVLAAPAFAQVKTSVTPPGWETTEAPSYAYYMGGLRDARMQFHETYLTGKGAKLISKVGYRRAGGIGNSHTARSWSNVNLSCFETKYSAISATFTANHLTSPVQVFSAAVKWPATTGSVSSPPAAFTSTYAFPFSKPWAYSAKQDVGLDYKFNGGTMANNATWASNGVFAYFLDAPTSTGSVGSGYYSYGQSTTTACKDAGQTSYAYTAAYSSVYAKDYGSPTLNNTMRFYLNSYRTAKSAQVVQVLDFGAAGGSTTGKAYGGITCNNLHLAASAGMLLFYKTANTSGTANTSFINIPWNPLFAGSTVWAQSIWDDSVSSAPKLTRASRSVVPKQPAGYEPRACIYAVSPATYNTYGYINRNYYTNPLIQWTH